MFVRLHFTNYLDNEIKCGGVRGKCRILCIQSNRKFIKNSNVGEKKPSEQNGSNSKTGSFSWLDCIRMEQCFQLFDFGMWRWSWHLEIFAGGTHIRCKCPTVQVEHILFYHLFLIPHSTAFIVLFFFAFFLHLCSQIYLPIFTLNNLFRLKNLGSIPLNCKTSFRSPTEFPMDLMWRVKEQDIKCIAYIHIAWMKCQRIWK